MLGIGLNLALVMHAEKTLRRFFIMTMGVFVAVLLLVSAWFSWLEWNYQILNFVQLKTPFHITSKQVLRQYITALDKNDHQIAYDYLSMESRKRHSFEEFADCLKDGHTVFDTRYFWDCGRKDNRLMLGIGLYEDPASWGFELIKNKKWRIVWEQGAPFFPYPDNYACGISE